jgi:hypothetical protein
LIENSAHDNKPNIASALYKTGHRLDGQLESTALRDDAKRQQHGGRA